MAFENVKCFGCQQFGHVERDCPNRNTASETGDGDKPPWCRECDRRTRIRTVRRDGRDIAVRCRCHPSGHLMAGQFRRCGECKAVIYEWDMNSECGSHLPVSKPREYIPETERTK
jgi:hypothetical protein